MRKQANLKRIGAMGMALVMVCSMAGGCGNAKNGKGGKQGNGTSAAMEDAIKKVLEDKEEVTITYWTGIGQTNYPYREAMVEAFEKEYPNITVDMTIQGPTNDMMEKLTQNIVSKTTPTLSCIAPSYFSDYVDSGAIVDLMPYYENEEIGFSEEERQAFIPAYIDEAMSFGEEGTMWGFPSNMKSADVLFYNKTYFDEQGWNAPETWDEVAKYSKSIKEDTGTPGFCYDVAYGESAFKMLSMQWGSPYVTEDGTPDINNDASKEAIKFYKDNYDAGYFTMPFDLPSSASAYSSKGFIEKECYMYVGAAAGAPYAVPRKDAGQEEFEVGISPIPQKDNENKIAFSKGVDYCIFSNATEEEKVAAWLLIEFMSRDEENVEWYSFSGFAPITSTMESVPEYKAFLETENDGSAEYYKALAVNATLEMNDYMRFEQSSALISELADKCGEMWKSVIIGGEDADTALERAEAEVK